jgi:hypothetical protein
MQSHTIKENQSCVPFAALAWNKTTPLQGERNRKVKEKEKSKVDGERRGD